MRRYGIAFAALGLATVLAALLAGCALPPYSEELSLAQVTRGKLGTPLLKIGPVYDRLDENASRDRYFFLPDRDDPASGGFLVGESSYGLRIWYVANYSSYSDLGSNHFVSVNNGNETANNYLLQPIESNYPGTYYLSLTRYAPAYNNVTLISATGPSTVKEGTIRTLTDLGLIYTLGANVFSDTTADSDPQFFLGSLGTASYQEYPCQTSSSSGFDFTPGDASATSSLGLVPDDVKNGFYAHNSNNHLSYLSLPSGSSYVSYSWMWDESSAGTIPSGFQQLVGVKGRIEAVLNNGQFLAFDDNTCRVYSDAGAKVCDFPLGGLKFCYERWDPVDPQFKLYFSLAYWLWGRDEKSDQLYVEVYAIPTDSLATLR
jgi:hypothetical protein